MSQLCLPTPVYFAPGVPLWDTATGSDALTGSSLQVNGNGVITGSVTAGSISVPAGNITSTGNLTVTGSISATVVNALKNTLGGTTVGGNAVNLVAGTAQVLNTTTDTFSFISGGTYLVSCPFSAVVTSQVYSGSATTGELKFFGCSATAFPLITNGVTPGYSYRVLQADTGSNSLFGIVQFIATAQATVTEGVRVAGVPVGALASATVTTSIQPSALNKIAVVRIA